MNTDSAKKSIIQKHKSESKTQGKRSKKQIAVSVISSVILVALLVTVAYVFYCNRTERIAFFGSKALVRIVSSSMEPTIPVGEYVIIEKISPEDISQITVGDVIIFYSRDPSIYGHLNTHRVTQIITGDKGTEFATKGDNNPVEDSLLTSSKDVVGRYVGNSDTATKLASFVMQKWVFFILILIPAAVVVMLCILDVMKRSKKIYMDILVEEKVKELREQDKKNNPEALDGDSEESPKG